MKDIFKKFLFILTPLVATFFFAFPAYAYTPAADYNMQGTCHNNQYCQEKITIVDNPSNYNVRAKVVCSDNHVYFGGWHTAFGAHSYGVCPNGLYVVWGGFVFDKTHQYQVKCWVNGYSKTGSC